MEGNRDSSDSPERPEYPEINQPVPDPPDTENLPQSQPDTDIPLSHSRIRTALLSHSRIQTLLLSHSRIRALLHSRIRTFPFRTGRQMPAAVRMEQNRMIPHQMAAKFSRSKTKQPLQTEWPNRRDPNKTQALTPLQKRREKV